jgi:V/A-type H+-transporting ATPase subunit K
MWNLLINSTKAEEKNSSHSVIQIKTNYGGKKMATEISVGVGLVAIGASLALGLSAIATGIAEKAIGTAAIGAMAEKEELFGKGLILTVIPESIVIFGLVVAILILGLVSA